MNAPMSLLILIGLLALAFVCAAAFVGLLAWRNDLRLRYSHEPDERRREARTMRQSSFPVSEVDS